jgi:site-specific DNA recombinase
MPRTDLGRRRCAIYTRKSSEEGLEQEFNSLAAQREACEAFILCQQHQGWISARSRYDDGGFSGGNLERPALQELLADIRAGRIDVVIVYKVDRLTRSLADFARLVELFDAQAVSFVSVTQHFNTTSSMGRLTLNVLLSFAQFEREVTGERIRDKIAASKKKGMWMGGNVPLGYDASEPTLVINPAEAETVRHIFALYRELGRVRRVKDEADRLGLRTKRRTMANGAERGGTPFSRGHIYPVESDLHRSDCAQGRTLLGTTFGPDRG